jgi:hypothetical protein
MSISHPFVLGTMVLLGETNAVVITVICIAACGIRTPRMELYRFLQHRRARDHDLRNVRNYLRWAATWRLARVILFA